MLKIVSTIGYFGMIGGILGLLILGSLFSFSPLVIALQASAVLLFLWARITFGWRSYHVVADPTEGGVDHIGTSGIRSTPRCACLL